ncbi:MULTISPECIES: DUF817 domain-containing protein [Gammaproteobacteria]|uniref:DUF817 domain-containing protein n=1 Tax=Gammaproteobacteria TaxID=1236 RepID=UPI000DD097CB|nr:MULTISPECIES: DUF817 domain-containing protein [Gammaproteobacteria]RTE87432.1 DUF817 domain-containing protein [Aliidiomarina sp. B3213]TCZ92783.1 DUF817 domain-containing protein [Lysobacter sp. N42]
MNIKTIIHEFWLFGLKQANACIFGGFLLGVMIVTNYWYPIESLHRYDFIFLAAIAFQLFLLIFRLETPREALVIIVFHIVATVMELFKTSDSIGSWVYPEEFIFGIANVPLFTGFMYSAVGSYIARVWRIFEFEYSHYPNKAATIVLVALIYMNFFTHHYIWDLRWLLLAFTVFLFYRTHIYFKIIKTHRNMPLLLGWFLVALFIWIAENIATFTNIWIYPNQTEQWEMVSFSKLSSWYLLMLLSFVLVSLINQIQIRRVLGAKAIGDNSEPAA